MSNINHHDGDEAQELVDGGLPIAAEANGASSGRHAIDSRAAPESAVRSAHPDAGRGGGAEPARSPAPRLFETDAGVLVLSDVSSVQCYAGPGGQVGASVCQVVLRSGVSVTIGWQYSRGLIEAIKAHHDDGAPVRSMILNPRTS